jgi:hypothetical protein
MRWGISKKKRKRYSITLWLPVLSPGAVLFSSAFAFSVHPGDKDDSIDMLRLWHIPLPCDAKRTVGMQAAHRL